MSNLSFKLKFGVAIIIFVLLLSACSSKGSATLAQSSSSTVVLPNKSESVSKITLAYETLFDLGNPSIQPKVDVVQNGQQLEASMKEAFNSSLSKAAGSAKVVSVSLEAKQACLIADENYPCAKVTYNLLTPAGTPIFTTPSTGYAIYLNDKWVVAKNTICSLLTLANSNKVPSGC